MQNDMQIQGFHATNCQLTELNYEKLLLNINNHLNGALGLWCAIRSDWIDCFGKNIYQVSIEGKAYDMPVDELAKYSAEYTSVQNYIEKRNNLLSLGYDFIRILETSGRCDMFIVLSFEKTTFAKN